MLSDVLGLPNIPVWVTFNSDCRRLTFTAIIIILDSNSYSYSWTNNDTSFENSWRIELAAYASYVWFSDSEDCAATSSQLTKEILEVVNTFRGFSCSVTYLKSMEKSLTVVDYRQLR